MGVRTQPLDIGVRTRVEAAHGSIGGRILGDVRLELQIRIRRIEEIRAVERDPDHVRGATLGGVGDNILEPVKVGMFSFRMI